VPWTRRALQVDFRLSPKERRCKRPRHSLPQKRFPHPKGRAPLRITLGWLCRTASWMCVRCPSENEYGSTPGCDHRKYLKQSKLSRNHRGIQVQTRPDSMLGFKRFRLCCPSPFAGIELLTSYSQRPIRLRILTPSKDQAGARPAIWNACPRCIDQSFSKNLILPIGKYLHQGLPSLLEL